MYLVKMENEWARHRLGPLRCRQQSPVLSSLLYRAPRAVTRVAWIPPDATIPRLHLQSQRAAHLGGGCAIIGADGSDETRVDRHLVGVGWSGREWVRERGCNTAFPPDQIPFCKGAGVISLTYPRLTSFRRMTGCIDISKEAGILLSLTSFKFKPSHIFQ